MDAPTNNFKKIEQYFSYISFFVSFLTLLLFFYFSGSSKPSVITYDYPKLMQYIYEYSQIEVDEKTKDTKEKIKKVFTRFAKASKKKGPKSEKIKKECQLEYMRLEKRFKAERAKVDERLQDFYTEKMKQGIEAIKKSRGADVVLPVGQASGIKMTPAGRIRVETLPYSVYSKSNLVDCTDDLLDFLGIDINELNKPKVIEDALEDN